MIMKYEPYFLAVAYFSNPKVRLIWSGPVLDQLLLHLKNEFKILGFLGTKKKKSVAFFVHEEQNELRFTTRSDLVRFFH